VRRNVGGVDGIPFGDLAQQPVEERDVGAWRQRQMQIRDLAGRGSPWIDDDDLGSSLFACRDKALIQNRVTPCQVRADEHDQIGQLQVFITARHRVAAESPLVAGDGGGHAQTRIGIDVGRADEAFHQFVGDVIIFGQQLAGDIERNRVRAVLRDCPIEALGNIIKRLIPIGLLPLHKRMKQPAIKRQRLAECRALGAQCAKVGGMIAIALDRRRAIVCDARDDAATNTAIGASGSDRPGCLRHDAALRPRAA
jgi:hypothetical protein